MSLVLHITVCVCVCVCVCVFGVKLHYSYIYGTADHLVVVAHAINGQSTSSSSQGPWNQFAVTE